MVEFYGGCLKWDIQYVINVGIIMSLKMVNQLMSLFSYVLDIYDPLKTVIINSFSTNLVNQDFH